MSTHNMFSRRNKKNINSFGLKKNILSRAMLQHLACWVKISADNSLKLFSFPPKIGFDMSSKPIFSEK